MPLGGSEDAPVGQIDGRLQPVGLIGQGRVDAARPREIRVFMGPADEAGHGVERQTRGHLSGVVPAHAVGHGVEPKRRLGEEAVFVGLAHRSAVGARRSGSHCRAL